METRVLAVRSNAHAVERDLKCDRQPVIVWLCNPSFHVLEGFLVCFNLIKICHCTSLAICLTGNKDI